LRIDIVQRLPEPQESADRGDTARNRSQSPGSSAQAPGNSVQVCSAQGKKQRQQFKTGTEGPFMGIVQRPTLAEPPTGGGPLPHPARGVIEGRLLPSVCPGLPARQVQTQTEGPTKPGPGPRPQFALVLEQPDFPTHHNPQILRGAKVPVIFQISAKVVFVFGNSSLHVAEPHSSEKETRDDQHSRVTKVKSKSRCFYRPPPNPTKQESNPKTQNQTPSTTNAPRKISCRRC